MIIMLARFKSSLPDAEVLRIMHDRAPSFRALPGLVQKNYIKDRETGEHGGMYFWDSDKSMAEYKKSELTTTIAEAYQTVGPPRVEIMDLLFPLRG